MAGVIRIVFGVIFLLGGLLLLATILLFFLGLFAIVLGIVLLASGVSARGDQSRMREQQAQTNLLLQQQMQLSAIQANRVSPPAPYYQPPQVVTAAPLQSQGYGNPGTAAPADRFCPVCGSGNQRASAFCQKCGKPLPPPP